MKPLHSNRCRRTGLFAVIVAAAGALSVSGCISTATYGTGKSPELAMFSELGASVPGLGGKKGKDIEYKPRSPLVMPPQTDLVEPGAGPTVTASVDSPDWPDDPDKRPEVTYSSGIDQAYLDRVKPYADLKEPESKVQPVLAEDGAAISSKDYFRNQKTYKSFDQDLADMKGLGKTERVYLTDPPEGYRVPADSAPTGIDGAENEEKGGIRKWWSNIRG